MKRSATAALVLLALMATARCGPEVEEIKVTLQASHCDGTALRGVYGVWVAMSRERSSMVLEDCRDTDGNYSSLDELQGKLAELSLERVPEAGQWDLWVVGTDRRCCLSQTGVQERLCGVVRGFSMPPPSNRIDVPVDCLDLVSGEKGPAAYGIAACKVELPSLGPQHGTCGL